MDFDEQMKDLVEDAKVQIDDRAVKKHFPGLNEALRPLIVGIEALGRTTMQHSTALNKIERAIFAQQELPEKLNAMQTNIDQRGAVTQQLFDSLYQEMKCYKDQFLLEILHKPIIRDLIALFDHLSELHRQMSEMVALEEGQEIVTETDLARIDGLKNYGMNLEHVSQFLLEVLLRMEVVRAEPSTGKCIRERHRAVAVEAAESEEEDGEIIRSCKPAFLWRGRVVRHEEVVIKKWKEGYIIAMADSQK